MEDEDKLGKKEGEKALTNVFRVGIAGQAMVTLTEGVFLVGLANALNAPLFLIGLLAAIPPLAQLVQMPSAYLVEKYRKRKRITLFAHLGTRISLLLTATIPILFSPTLGLTLLLIFILCRGIFAAIANTAWNSMVRDIVPQSKLGAFFSKR
ncbi:MAG: MFS transporter [Candidatus Hadarchaeia archaeon]